MSTNNNNRKFGKAKVATSGKTVTVGRWIAYGYVDSRGVYHGQVRRGDAHFRQSIDMNSADAILENVDEFVRACEAATSGELERVYLSEHVAKPSEAPAPTAKRFGKPIE